MQPVRIELQGLQDNPPHADLYYGIDAIEGLKLLPDKSVQMIATSPPYWGLRDYGVEGQLGAENSPEDFVQNLVNVFREGRRVLRDDGTLWLNLGDSYTSKSLTGIPWMVAFALRADGWYLRSEIIWAKTSGMPEAVTDRPTKAHETIFLLSKNSSYFYDQDAIRDPISESTLAALEREANPDDPDELELSLGGNKRTVWTINPKPYRGAHFAAWPADLVEIMIKAGSSERGCCSNCGSPWIRVLEKSKGQEVGDRDLKKHLNSKKSTLSLGGSHGWFRRGSKILYLGWEATCECAAGTMPCTVLDVFSGSATTGMVALNLGRNYIGIDLNPEYLPLAETRIQGYRAPEISKDQPREDTSAFDELFRPEVSDEGLRAAQSLFNLGLDAEIGGGPLNAH